MLTVAALYKFTPFADPAALKAPLATIACANGVKGTILLASEGINGTIAGPVDGIAAVLSHIRALPGCADIDWKESAAETQPFLRLKVRLKTEIVTMGQAGVDPTRRVGAYVAPADWNDLIAEDDVAVIDTRNGYEIGLGRFDGAIDPGTTSFSDFPAWWAENADRFAGKRVAMYCTGGIRCEKASSWLLDQGVEEVFHLKGGILKYLEETEEADSRWRGECFVFDDRVSVGHGLVVGDNTMCRACGRPVSAADRAAPVYEDGVACPACADLFSEEDRDRFRERQRQIALARARGAKHLGGQG